MSPVPTYRAAIIGTGRIASLLERDPLRPKPHSHAGWYASCPRTELVAGCDTNPERLRMFGDDWGLPPVALFGDYHEMLDRVRPDIVSICAYAPERRAMIDAAVQNGCRGLWIEKAIACSLDEAAAIAALIEQAGVAAVVDQPRRGDSRYVWARDLIRSGAWGALQSVHCLMSGHLVHTGVHAWDVLALWCGTWSSAAGWLDAEPGLEQNAGPPGFRDRGGHAHIVFDSGTHAFVSGGAKGYFVFQFDLLFDRGRVRLGNDVEEAWQPAPSPRYAGFLELASTSHGDCPAAAHRPLLVDLVEALDRGGEPIMTVSHAIQAFRLGVALFQSHEEGHRPIRPHEVRRDLYIASV